MQVLKETWGVSLIIVVILIVGQKRWLLLPFFRFI